jgi:CRISPR-associated endonuclease Csn1
MKKLLMENIPDEFIERQLNDSRYISKVVKRVLSNIVREKIDEENYEPEATSKNLISCNGAITDRLKKDWGMNDVWNSIILPRFIRMNQITGKDCFTTTNAEGHLIPQMPLELQKGFNKKRIDHRHHAMDAIVIACTTRDHVNLLNNEAAHSKYNANRYQLQRKLRHFEKAMIDGKEREVAKEFLKPWDSFTTDSKKILENIIVSFKQNQRVINKTTNAFQHFDENGKKTFVKQGKGDSWAIRKPMHKDTVFGEVNLKKIKEVSFDVALKDPTRIADKVFKSKILALKNDGKNAKDIKQEIGLSKIKVYYFTNETNDRYFATRKPLDISFDSNKIKTVTDTGIQRILADHLKTKDTKDKKGNIIEHPEIAFSPDGIDEMSKNIVELNNGKFHQPILKVRVYEKADKFAVGQIGNKKVKFVEAAKGTNLFFAIFEKNGKRSYLTIPLNVMIDCQKKYGNLWKQNIESYLKEKELAEKDVQLLFILSPNDLVYLPTEQNLEKKDQSMNKERIYKFVDCSGSIANFVPSDIAQAIFSMTKDDQNENFKGYRYGIQNEIGVGSRPSKSQNAITGEMIKETCIPIKVDRLGNIKSVGMMQKY